MEDTTFFEHVHVILDSSLRKEELDILRDCSNVEIMDLSDLRTALMTVFERSQFEYLLVVTNETVKDMIIGFNEIISKSSGKYISVLTQDTLYAEHAKAQMEEELKTVYTQNGTIFIPEREIVPMIFTDKKSDAILCFCSNVSLETVPEGSALYDADNNLCGYVLEDEFSAKTLMGTITEVCVGNIGFNTKLEIAKLITEHAVKAVAFPDFDTTLLFSKGDETKLFAVPASDSEKDISPKELTYALFYIFFGHEPTDKDKLEILFKEKNKHTDYPSAVFCFFEEVFAASILPSLTKTKITTDQIMSTLVTIHECEKEE